MNRKYKGMVEKYTSYMMAVAASPDDLDDPEQVSILLDCADDFQLLEIGFDEEMENSFAAIQYRGTSYRFWFYLDDFNFEELYDPNDSLSNRQMELLEQADTGLMIAMDFSGDDLLAAYQLQLKILDCLVPKLLGVADINAQRILSPVWAKMAARASVPPAPFYLYSLQAVAGDEDGQVWIHTHGLNRCGIIELEIIDSDEENCSAHCAILHAMANRAICENDMSDEKEPIYVASLANGDSFVATWVDWREVVAHMPPAHAGSFSDREETHSEDSGIVQAYLSSEDWKNEKPTPFSQMDPVSWDNPLMMVTLSETRRMATLAQERVSFLKIGLNIPGASAVAKMALDVDEEKQEEAGTDLEHIWLSVQKIDDQYLSGALTQEPYFVSKLHMGDALKIPLERLTDWALTIDDYHITPDSAYLLIQDMS